jgi:hypothetical protein
MLVRRLFVALAISVALFGPGSAQQPDIPIDPRTLTRTEVQLLQDAFVWNGLYLGLKDGGWGRMTEEGLRNWRQRLGSYQTGGPTPREFARLMESARAAQQGVGWTTWRDPIANIWIGYPARLVRPVPIYAPNRRGHDYASGDGLIIRTRQALMSFAEIRGLLASLQAQPNVDAVTYRLDRSDRQVLSQRLRNGALLYVRFDSVGAEWRGFSVEVPANYPFPDAISAIASEFNASGTPVIATPLDTPNFAMAFGRAPGQQSVADRPLIGSSPPQQAPTPAVVAPSPPVVARVSSQHLTQLAREGSPQDLLALVNVSPSAPNATLTLSGDVTFLSTRIVACRPTEQPLQVPLTFALEDWLSERRLDVRGMALRPCGNSSFDTLDMAVLRRAELGRLDPVTFNSVARAVEGRTAVVIALLTDAAARSATEARSADRAANQTRVDAGSPGFGVIAFGDQGSNACIAASGAPEVWRAALVRVARALQLDLDALVQLEVMTSDLDAAFISARRGGCRVLVGDSLQLRAVLAAVRRDRLQATLTSVWLEPDQVRAVAEESRATTEAAARAVERARQEAEQARGLLSSREQAEGVERARRTEALRATSRVQATAMRETISLGARSLFSSDNPGAARWARDAFPELDRQMRRRLSEGWELQGVDAEVFEFGQGQWSGRSLSTAVVRLSLRMSNRQVGRYDTACFLLGYQDDAEFRMTRSTTSADCASDGERRTASWLSGLGFESRWNAR